MVEKEDSARTFSQRRSVSRRLGRGGRFEAQARLCVCPHCGYSEARVYGIPCISKKCPECGTQLVCGE